MIIPKDETVLLYTYDPATKPDPLKSLIFFLGGSSGNIHVHDRSLEDKIHTGDTGGRTLNVTLVKNEKTRRYIIPLKESGKDKNAHQVPGLDKSAKVPEQFPLLNSTSHKSRSSIGAKPLSIFSPSLQKQMISTMHRTVHIAAWGKIFHL